MTGLPDAVARPPAPTGVDTGEWAALLARGQAAGELHAEEIAHVMRHVELTPAVLESMQRELVVRGIHLDEQVEELPDDTPPGGRPRTAAPEGSDEPDADAPARSAARRRRLRPAAERSDAGTSDSVRMYLKEIGRVDLLSGEDERRLAQAIEAGEEAAVRVDADGVDPMERRTLLRTVRRGQQAKDELIQANLRLVVSIAKRYAGRGMPLLDLVQEGNLGLMRAVDKFDHTKGFKFSTYATWWIRQAITRSIADQGRTIRIPVHVVESMNRVLRVQRQMHQELEREPTVDELARRCGLSHERTREILRISLDPLSLDSPVGEEDESSLGDFIEDVTADAPAEVATKAMLTHAVDEALGELSPRERDIVRMRFGLVDGNISTLDDVARMLGVTRERVRQLEAKILAKLRHPMHGQRLKEFLDQG